jgi:hypothetical protein
MGNPKHIAVIAGLGFFLSFLIGIISGVSFSLLFLRALVTAVLFAVIGFSAEIVIKKILLDKVPDGLPVATAPGSAVDISIEDEDLPEDANAPYCINKTWCCCWWDNRRYYYSVYRIGICFRNAE